MDLSQMADDSSYESTALQELLLHNYKVIITSRHLKVIVLNFW